jgi:hypothetical protein
VSPLKADPIPEGRPYFGYINDTTGDPSQPNQRQAVAHRCVADELCYGGAAGGGKSDWLLVEAGTVLLEHAGVEAALFRRTYEELEASLILRSHALFNNLVAFKLAKYEAGRKRWVFFHRGGNSYLWFRYCARESDVYRYQSAQWVFLGLDEATHFTEFQYTYLTSRVRSRKKQVKVKIRLATNPGNVGHAWVKRRFIKPESVETGGVLVAPEQIWTPLPSPERPTAKMMSRCFVPAKLTDNNALMSADPDYFHRLQQLPEDERRMLSEGDWDVWKGQMFSEFTELHRVTGSDKELLAAGLTVGEVIPWHKLPDATWQPPPGATVFLSVDYGYAAPWAAYFHCVLPGGRVVTFREFYHTRKRDVQQAKLLKEYIERVWRNQSLRGQEKWQVLWGVMDQSMWGSRKEQGLGKSIGEVYEEEFGIPTKIVLKPGSRDRHARVQRVKQALGTGPDGFPWWQITAACPNLLRTLPELPHDADDPEDIDTDAEDHAYDAVGLFWQARPELPKSAQRAKYLDLDELSREHALAMDKKYAQKGKPGVLDTRGFSVIH